MSKLTLCFASANSKISSSAPPPAPSVPPRCPLTSLHRDPAPPLPCPLGRCLGTIATGMPSSAYLLFKALTTSEFCQMIKQFGCPLFQCCMPDASSGFLCDRRYYPYQLGIFVCLTLQNDQGTVFFQESCKPLSHVAHTVTRRRRRLTAEASNFP